MVGQRHAPAALPAVKREVAHLTGYGAVSEREKFALTSLRTPGRQACN